MVFELNKSEIKIFNRWKNSLPEISEDHLDVFGKEFQYTFKFQPTGLGLVKIVERDYDGLKLNLTDYSNW